MVHPDNGCQNGDPQEVEWGGEVAGITKTGETVTPQQALDKLVSIVAAKYPQDDLFEKLAAIEHERWADWQKYLHSHGIPNTQGKGYLCLPMGLIKHWERQIATPYAELSEQEKNSDREQVMRYWSLINPDVKGE